LYLESLRNRGGVNKIFYLQLFLPELLFEPVLLCIIFAKLIEDSVFGTAQVYSANQNSRHAKNNKNKSKSGPHNLVCHNWPYRSEKSRINHENRHIS